MWKPWNLKRALQSSTLRARLPRRRRLACLIVAAPIASRIASRTMTVSSSSSSSPSSSSSSSSSQSVAMQRLTRVCGHVTSSSISSSSSSLLTLPTSSSSPATTSNDSTTTTATATTAPHNPLRWNGWGYRDTEFQLTPDGRVTLTGHRYAFSGRILPSLRTWMEEKVGIDVREESPSQPEPKCPRSVVHEPFVRAIAGHYKRIDWSDSARLFHAHGHTAQEMFLLRYGKFERVPDVVVYPGCHEHVEAIVRAAHACAGQVVIIPYGGGTNVTQALMCARDEQRMIVSLDMREMNAIRWINRKNMTACIEAGAVGKDLEQQLRSSGLVLGHEPDSAEFSTLGGWVATRASGMRKNRYGNIEDIVVQTRMVTANGTTLSKSVMVPRMSTGPDVQQMVLGSEGMLGVVTEAVVRVREPAECIKYGSVIFPNFELGVACLYEVQRAGCVPVSMRLVDNMQFQFGQALKPEQHSVTEKIVDKIKKWYVLNRLNFDPNAMVAATLLFEGSKAEVAEQERRVFAIAAKHGGVNGGAENGIRGYFLTYMIAYLRDFGFNYSFIAESFETSVPWDKIVPLCDGVKSTISQVARAHGVKREPLVSCRVTQLYETGVCVYFYFGFVWTGLKDPVTVFSTIEHEARATILRNGGSLSHHHGVGKLRKDFMRETVSEQGIVALQSLKRGLDPHNIFAARNLVDV